MKKILFPALVILSLIVIACGRKIYTSQPPSSAVIIEPVAGKWLALRPVSQASDKCENLPAIYFGRRFDAQNDASYFWFRQEMNGQMNIIEEGVNNDRKLPTDYTYIILDTLRNPIKEKTINSFYSNGSIKYRLDDAYLSPKKCYLADRNIRISYPPKYFWIRETIDRNYNYLYYNPTLKKILLINVERPTETSWAISPWLILIFMMLYAWWDINGGLQGYSGPKKPSGWILAISLAALTFLESLKRQLFFFPNDSSGIWAAIVLAIIVIGVSWLLYWAFGELLILCKADKIPMRKEQKKSAPWVISYILIGTTGFMCMTESEIWMAWLPLLVLSAPNIVSWIRLAKSKKKLSAKVSR